MKKDKITFNQLVEQITKLSNRDFGKLITAYQKENPEKKDKRFERMVISNLQSHLIDLNVNDRCPSCGGQIIEKYGKRPNGVQRLRCTECGCTFTYFTGTVLEKTKFHWDMWVDLIYYMIHDYSNQDIVNNMIENNNCVGLTKMTVMNWRHKILEACTQIEQPELLGTVQIDETHFRESQKGTKKLITVNELIPRYARYSYEPALYGPMGTEFATVITAIDETQHVVMKVSGLGRCDLNTFAELFDNHLKNIKYLATDANTMYQTYSFRREIPHYVRPSDYLDIIKGKTQEEIEELYEDGNIDYMANGYRRLYTYQQFERLKKEHKLNLGLVNSLHNEIKGSLNHSLRGVSSKYLNGYISWIALLKNYRADNNFKPASTREDAERLLCIILKKRINPLLRDLEKKSVEDLPTPDKNFLKRLHENTDIAREKKEVDIVFDTEYFGEEENVERLLYEIPAIRLREIAKLCNIKGYTSIKKGNKFKYIQQLKEMPNIREAFLEVMAGYAPNREDDRKL